MRRIDSAALAAILFSLALAPTALLAKVSAEEAAKLGNELTPVGGIKAGNEAGTIPAWEGDVRYTEVQKSYDPEDLEELRKEALDFVENNPDLVADPDAIAQMSTEEQLKLMEKIGEKEPRIGDLLSQVGDDIFPKFEITASNYKEYADNLSAGQKAMFERYSDYKMVVYPTVRGAYYPEEINKATKANATRATLEGTDGVSGAELGFPYPIPKNGAQVIWNHKLKFRGSAVKRYNNQAIVDADGSFEITKLIEDVNFEYGNLALSEEDRNDEILAYYLQETISPPRVAGQITLVHEIFGLGTSGRNAWLYNPGLGRVNRAPDVGYDNPSLGSDGLQFNDQVDVFNGALDRYTWKLVGKKEIFIPYNSYMMNNPLLKYKDLIRKGHLNQAVPRYELHRVWVVDATLRDGVRHQFKRRTFYVDEDSWSVALVDCYDNRDQLWKLQEAHLTTFPFIPTTTGSPEVIYDLQSGRYFVTAMTNEDTISDYRISYEEGYFTPSSLKRRARTR